MAAATATAVAAAAPRVTAHPPSSPFAELFRRSRFATFDPAIRQTYSSAPAHVHRGDWGLKRPIAVRRKNQFITITTPEHHAHFTEWNRAEDEVRFIRRVDELDIMPRTTMSSPWYRGLGKASKDWLLDSEFCSEDMQDMQAKKEQEHLARQHQQQPPVQTFETVDLSTLGKLGPGAYGMHRPLPSASSPDKPDNRVMPNINAMSPKQFKRYLRHLRTLRPAFKDYIENNREKPRIASKSLYALAQNPDAGIHRRFIQDHLTSQLQDPTSTKFEQNPHRNAALTYAHPTPLDTLYRSKPQPGFVLNTIQLRDKPTSNVANSRAYVASFGGIAATLPAKHAGGKIPLLDPDSETGIDKNRIHESIAQFRLMKNRGFVLDVPPRVVGRHPDTLDAVRIDAKVVVVDGQRSGLPGNNPYPPGSPEYVAATAVDGRSGSRNLAPPPKSTAKLMGFTGPVTPVDAKARFVLDTLSSMMPGRKDGRQLDGNEEL